jgi:hypothetical protein
MAVSPFHHAFVQIDETLAQLGQSRVIAIDLDQDGLQVGRRLDRPVYVALQKGDWNRGPARGEETEERIPKGRRSQSPLECESRPGTGRVAFQGPGILAAQRELELAELVGLESAARVEAVPE